MGLQLSWESTCLASRMSRVRLTSVSPPRIARQLTSMFRCKSGPGIQYMFLPGISKQQRKLLTQVRGERRVPARSVGLETRLDKNEVPKGMRVEIPPHRTGSCGRIRLKTLSSLITADYNGNKRASAIWGMGLPGVVVSLARRKTAGFDFRMLHHSSFTSGSA